MELMQEFMHETTENLLRLEQALLGLERNPADGALLNEAFRLLHMVKGSCGFLKLPRLGGIAHHGEHLLGRFRNDNKPVTADALNELLKIADDMNRLLQYLGEHGKEPAQETDLPSANTAAAATIRLPVERIDELMNLMSEIILARNAVPHLTQRHDDVVLSANVARLNRNLKALQDCVLRTRMQPVRHIWQSLPRLVHDLSQQLDKKITLTVTGDDTELDRSVLERLKEPFVHLIRNAADHGIETPQQRIQAGKNVIGAIRLAASSHGDHVVLTIEDDGRGLDTNAIRDKAGERFSSPDEAVFAPGFSTASAVTDVSGRGVGLDIVRAHVTAIGGSVHVESSPGAFCRFVLTLPATLLIVPALLLRVRDHVFALPQECAVELLRLSASSPRLTRHAEKNTLQWHDDDLPLVSLNEKLGLPPSPSDKTVIAVLRAGNRMAALRIDAAQSGDDCIVKPLPAALKSCGAYSGVTVLKDGAAALLLDPSFLVDDAIPTAFPSRSMSPTLEGVL